MSFRVVVRCFLSVYFDIIEVRTTLIFSTMLSDKEKGEILPVAHGKPYEVRKWPTIFSFIFVVS